MNRKDVLEPRGPRTDSQETTPLLTDYSHTENTGGSAVDGSALHRNEQDGKNIPLFTKTSLHVLSECSITGDHGETYDNVPKGKRQIGQVITTFNPVVLELNRSHSVGLFSATFLIFNAVIGTG